MEITYQKQPTSNTCSSTCLAMILNVPVEQVIKEFHEPYLGGKINPDDFLSGYGIDFVINSNPYNFTMEWGKTYLLTVASLNIPGGLHHILVDMGHRYVS